MAKARKKKVRYPDVKDRDLVGTYGAQGCSGGGFVWDAVLEYRVWCHPERGARDLERGNDYFVVFETYEQALKYSKRNEGTEEPLALILQEEYIDEPEFGKYIHVKEQRITEWPVEWLERPKRTDKTIPDFLAAHAPSSD